MTPYIGEIRLFAGNFAPNGWAFCNGQLMAIAENDTLFNLIGTTYGGDGMDTFALPNLQSRVPIHMGQGPGISQNYQIGEMGGTETVTLSTNQMPVHTHVPSASNAGVSDSPSGNVWGASASAKPYVAAPGNLPMNAQSIGSAGGSQPHNNMIPFVGVNYIISLFGVYPTQF